MSERIAEEIRVILVRRKLTATDVAQRAGMTQPYISRRLTGDTEFGINDLEKIAEALGVEVADLLPRAALSDERGAGRINERSGHAPRHPRSSRLLDGHQTSRTADHHNPTPVKSGATASPRSRPAWTHSGVTA